MVRLEPGVDALLQYSANVPDSQTGSHPLVLFHITDLDFSDTSKSHPEPVEAYYR